MSELAKSLGRAAGVVTTVEWSHATPAGFSNAHVAERDDYQDIAQQMLQGGVLDVIMGAGNPDFDNDGQPWQLPQGRGAGIQIRRRQGNLGCRSKRPAKRPDGLYQGYRPVSTKAEFEALC